MPSISVERAVCKFKKAELDEKAKRLAASWRDGDALIERGAFRSDRRPGVIRYWFKMAL